jgi:hypothetical protein
MSTTGDGRQPDGQTVKKGAHPETVVSGPGALCAEAQADGVPCTELGRDCQVCERAEQRLAGEKLRKDPA